VPERPGAGRNTVRHHFMGHRLQGADTLDLNDRCSGALDPGTHLAQEGGDVADLRLASRIGDPSPSLGQNRRHQDVLRRTDTGEVQPDIPPMKAAGRLGDQVAMVDAHRGSQRLQTRSVHVQTAGPDGVTSRNRDIGPTASRHQWSQDTDGRPQRPNQLVVGLVHDAVGNVEFHGPGIGVILDGAPQPAQQLRHDRHVKNCRHVGQPGPAHSQQGPRHQLQCAVLGTNDRDFSPQAGATDNPEPLVHTASLPSRSLRGFRPWST
jgi:hypothetical protein